MTRNEAIQELAEWIKQMKDHGVPNYSAKYKALGIAMEALSEDISEDGTLKVNVEDGSKVNRVLVCGDNHFGGLYYPD